MKAKYQGYRLRTGYRPVAEREEPLRLAAVRRATLQALRRLMDEQTC